jgi:hypothetical protein
MQTIFISIQNRLKTITGLKYIDEDWGQLEAYSDHPPVSFPMALIDLDSLQWSDEGAGMQSGEGSVTITVADLKVTRSNAHATQQSREKAFGIFTHLEEVHQKLHGWCPADGCSKLSRTSTQKVKREDGIKEYKVKYSIVVETELPSTLTAPAQIVILPGRII